MGGGFILYSFLVFGLFLTFRIVGDLVLVFVLLVSVEGYG